MYVYNAYPCLDKTYTRYINISHTETFVIFIRADSLRTKWSNESSMKGGIVTEEV